MNNATHVAVYFGSYLKKPPVPMSRLEHYAGLDEIDLRYNSHRIRREEKLVMSGDEFMERFSWHVSNCLEHDIYNENLWYESLHSSFFRIIAFRMVNSLRMQATRATFLTFPAVMSRV